MKRLFQKTLLEICIGVSFALGPSEGLDARELLLPKEQENTQIGEIGTTPLNQKNWTSPQSVFSWIAMARGYETPWDSLGREGWMTQDASIQPIDPGTTVFPPSTPAVYIVFEIPPLDAPGQWGAAWYRLRHSGGGTPSQALVGTDHQEMDWNEKFGYLELRQPPGGWEKGRYLVKLYFGSPGQQLHATNLVGTMEFVISDTPDTPSY